jgi:hypothetical protein
MLSQIVRPLVYAQIRLLANSGVTRKTLIEIIAQWLSYLGVKAVVTHLESRSDQIQVSLSVSKPEGCDRHDWQQIICNLNRGERDSYLSCSSRELVTRN